MTDDTNVLFGTPALYRYAQSKAAEDHLVDYINTVSSMLGTELCRIAGDYGVRVLHLPYYSIQHVEFVWEFQHDSPIRYVEATELPLRALGETTVKNRALVRGEEVRSTQNSFIVKAELSSGCTLAVYAKTNLSVRFEVRLNDYRIGKTLKDHGIGGRTTNSLVNVHAMLGHLRQSATRELMQAMAALERSTHPLPDGPTPIDLCLEVTQALQDIALSKSVLETLRNRGSLASPQGSLFKGATRQLTSAGILMRRGPRHPVYVPQERWVSAVARLRGM
ncbi:hypothetical protein OO012_09315 [Rhodobacteraceae bacterium KMM 6894]|nr:hypothetical protein [Rhodobacteraceae bacterium KMM 6894]